MQVVACRMEDLFQALLEDADVMHVVGFLLSNAAAGKSFLALLANMMVNEKLELLSNIQVKVSA